MSKTPTIYTEVNWVDPTEDPRFFVFRVAIDQLVEDYNKAIDKLRKYEEIE